MHFACAPVWSLWSAGKNITDGKVLDDEVAISVSVSTNIVMVLDRFEKTGINPP